MLLWAKNYVFVSINSRDLVITELPEESTFCFDQSQCSIDARRWINSGIYESCCSERLQSHETAKRSSEIATSKNNMTSYYSALIPSPTAR